MQERQTQTSSPARRQSERPGAGRTMELAKQVSWEFLGEELGRDVEEAIVYALQNGAHFPGNEQSALTIFQEGLAGCIQSIQEDQRWLLFKRLLTQGPVDPCEETSSKSPTERLSDEETSSVISFIFHRMIPAFQGLLAELLATAPSTELMLDLQKSGQLPNEGMLYCGDAVLVPQRWRKPFVKGADFHYLAFSGEPTMVQVLGVAEVKSYYPQASVLVEQIQRHVSRLQAGLKINGQIITPSQVLMPKNLEGILRVSASPGFWTLSRMFRFQGDHLVTEHKMPPSGSYKIDRNNPNDWQITLRWSREALAAVAHDMTFWYMGIVGEEAFLKVVPPEWEGMTPIDAGRNAVKSSLYYAILRSRNPKEESQAVALYNSYGFGYSLGMNFKNREGRRQMLWVEDLHEIRQSGVTKKGYTIWQK